MKLFLAYVVVIGAGLVNAINIRGSAVSMLTGSEASVEGELANSSCVQLSKTVTPPLIDGITTELEWTGCTSLEMRLSGKSNMEVLANAKICVDCSYWYVKVGLDIPDVVPLVGEVLGAVRDSLPAGEYIVTNGGSAKAFIKIDDLQPELVAFAWIEESGLTVGFEAKYKKPADKDMYSLDVHTDVYANGESQTAANVGATLVCYDMNCAAATDVPAAAPTKSPVADLGETETDTLNLSSGEGDHGSGPGDGEPETEEKNEKTQTATTDYKDSTLRQNGQTGEGGSFGDPHLKTWGGERFDFHGECDLVLVHSESFADNKGLDIHIRTEIRKNWSFISDAVLRIGHETIEINKQGTYFLNGVMNAPMPSAIAGFPIAHSLSKKGRLTLDIDLGHRGHIFFREYKEFVSVHIVKGQKEDFSDSTGLMGEFSTGRMLLRDGKTTEYEPNLYAQEWQVRDTEISLFRDVRAPQFPQTCRLPEASKSNRRLDSGVTYDQAAKACEKWGGDIEGCIYDVMATGDLELAWVGSW